MLLYLPVALAQLTGPLFDIDSALSISPHSASDYSLLLSGVTVNALAFTFRIAYQKVGCSIFVPVLNLHPTIDRPPFPGRGSSPYYGAARRLSAPEHSMT